MSHTHSIPPTVQISRTRLVGLVMAVAALAAAVTSAFAAFAFDSGPSTAGPNAQTFRVPASAIGRLGSLAPAFAVDGGTASSTASSLSRPVSSVAQNARHVPSMPLTSAQAAALASIRMEPSRYLELVLSLTPAQLPAGALGTGYTPPTRQGGLTVESVLASMSPQTRRYTERIMNLTFAQLAAGAAGHP